MNQIIKILILIACVSVISSCGLKGPLYEPSAHTATLMFTSPLFYKVV